MAVFGEYDLNKIASAKKELIKVYEYNYGDPRMRKELSRLKTIINKISELEDMTREES